MDTRANCVYVIRFRVCERGILCVLEMNSNGKLKWGHEFCPSETKNITKNIPTTAISIATKLDRAVTYHERLPPIKLHDPFFM